MNIAKILHNKAMEFADEANLAKMEGNDHAKMAFLRNALTLEKEAILQLGQDENKTLKISTKQNFKFSIIFNLFMLLFEWEIII